MPMTLTWIKCQGEVWCKLNVVNLPHEHFNNMAGVYIIWHGGPSAKTVYVGQGDIRSRFTEHRTDPRIQTFEALGLYATWAAVPAVSRNGIERYLAERLNPLVPEAHPADLPIEVNLPW